MLLRIIFNRGRVPEIQERHLRELCSRTGGCIFWKAEPLGTGAAPQPCTCHLNTGTATSRKNCLLVSYLFMRRGKSLTLAARPALSLFCSAARATKLLPDPHVHRFKPELYEPKNFLQTPVPKPRPRSTIRLCT